MNFLSPKFIATIALMTSICTYAADNTHLLEAGTEAQNELRGFRERAKCLSRTSTVLGIAALGFLVPTLYGLSFEPENPESANIPKLIGVAGMGASFLGFILVGGLTLTEIISYPAKFNELKNKSPHKSPRRAEILSQQLAKAEIV